MLDEEDFEDGNDEYSIEQGSTPDLQSGLLDKLQKNSLLLSLDKTIFNTTFCELYDYAIQLNGICPDLIEFKSIEPGIKTCNIAFDGRSEDEENLIHQKILALES